MSALPVAGSASVRRAVFALIRNDPGGFVLSSVLTILGAAAGLASPVLVGMIIDAVAAGGGPESVDHLGLLLIMAAATQLVLVFVARTVGLRWGERAAARLREQLASRVLALPGSRVAAVGTGDLTARATTDVGLVSTVLRDAVPEVAFAAVQAVIITVALFVLDVRLGVCAVAGLIGIGAALRWYLRRAKPAYLALSSANAELGEILQASTSGGRTVELLGLARKRRSVLADAVTGSRKQVRATLRLRTVLFTSIDLAHAAAGALVLLVGGMLLLGGGDLTLGVVVAALLFVNRLSVPLDTVLIWTETMQSALASFARIEGVAIAVEPERASTETAVPTGVDFELDEVSFSYGDHEVLHQLSATVRGGERVAVVGASGAGKSTLARLMAGLVRPDRGQVRVGGVPVADLAVTQRRQEVLLVTQDHHVFADTLRNNLALGVSDVDDAGMWSALRTVGATWAPRLPEGLDTVLDDEALSGAEAQQLALARIVLADPHTLILDEATALLDPTSARGTERTLAQALAGRTVISIAHRLQTAKDADRVVVMQDGRITEQGTHEELITAGGSYAELWTAWRG
ncbi:ABC transporter ATP-binding protein [Propionibacteriaceae bacterium Y1685]|uniref:ABC transporter ATP-binding protein n=1 Tax=Microlunatus sp. Y1700 TaxID=3418487 RepID=UPI003B7CC7CB